MTNSHAEPSRPEADGEPKTPAWLHIHPQAYHHDSAKIEGTSAGLKALADALLHAIERRDGSALVFASDGEGYDICVRRSRGPTHMGTPFYLQEATERAARQQFAELHDYKRLIEKQATESLEALRWCRANGDPHHTTRLPPVSA